MCNHFTIAQTQLLALYYLQNLFNTAVSVFGKNHGVSFPFVVTTQAQHKIDSVILTIELLCQVRPLLFIR